MSEVPAARHSAVAAMQTRQQLFRTISVDESNPGTPRLRGPKPDSRFLALVNALKARDVAEVRQLLRRGHPVNYSEPAMGNKTPLISAAEYGFVDGVVELLNAGANANAADAAGATPLHMAAGGDYLPTVRVLISRGAHVNTLDSHGSTPLHYAAGADSQEPNSSCLVEALLAAGARCGLRDREGQLPLHKAAGAGSASVVRVLAREPYKATVNLKDNEGRTPLHCAVQGGRSLDVVETLLQLESIINAKDKQGHTPLHLAAKRQVNYVDEDFDGACLELLLAHGASVATTNNEGYNALSLALRRTMWWGRPGSRDHILDAVRQLVFKGSCVQDGFAMWRMVESFPSLVPIALNRSFSANTSARDSPHLRLDFDFNPLLVSAQQLRQTQRQSPLLPQTDLPKALLQENEVSMLHYIMKAGRKRLLLHPLCHSFLHLKWYKVRKYFLANVIFYLLFVLSLTAFLLCSPNCPKDEIPSNDTGNANANTTASATANTTDSVTAAAGSSCRFERSEAGLVGLTWWCLVIFSGLLDLREIIQIWQNPVLYIFNVGNILDATLVFCVPLLLLLTSENSDCCLNVDQQQVGAVTVVLAWVRFMLFTGQFPSCGVYIVMFSTVARNVFKFLAMYVFILLACALGFHVLLRPFKTFENPYISFVTSLVMMTGELDYTDTFLDSTYKVLSIVMLVGFMLFVYIILSNLLVGLAVSDMYAIQQRSELLRLTRHVELMVQVENLFRSRLVPNALQRLLLRSITVIDAEQRPTVSVYPNSSHGLIDSLFLFLSRTLGGRRLLIKIFEMFISGFIDPEEEPSLPPQLITSVLDVALREHELDKRERLLHLRSLQLGVANHRPGPSPSAPSSHLVTGRASVRPAAVAGRASWRWTLMSETDGDDDPPDFLHPASATQPPCNPLWSAPSRAMLLDPNVRLEEIKILLMQLQTRMDEVSRQAQDQATHSSQRNLDIPTAAQSLETVNEVIV
ncbi:Transient receptor potential channel pyrexia [Portunus trituberculatus]|uniref:Transient receptor potential channel pyrexia n=1 Tax=Portunus trituberculatus TaxID=210409 RepID=A0A5B7CZU1_PORTR|nr:Transient receptor potential channel pyrexia [Portunus trituberculatus]